MKRFLSIFLIIALMVSLSLVTTAVATLGDTIADALFELELRDREMFVELLQLFYDVDNREDLADAYQDAFESLTSGQQDRLEGYGGAVAVVSGFVEFLTDEENDQALENFAGYLEADDAASKAAVATAINNREQDFRDAVNNDIEAVEAGIRNLEKLFLFLASSRVMNTEVFIYNTSTGGMSLDTARAAVVIDAVNDIIVNDIEDVDSVVSAMQAMPDYYNSASAHDKNLAKAYLTEYGFIRNYTPPYIPPGDVVTPQPTPTPTPPPAKQEEPAGTSEQIVYEATVQENEGVVTGTVTKDELSAIIDTKDDRPVVISAKTGSEDVRESKLTIEMPVIEPLSANNDNQLIVSTDVGSIGFTPSVLEDTLAAAADGTDDIVSVTLSLAALDKEEAAQRGLTEEQKATVPEGSVIYSISLEYTKIVGNETVTESLTSDYVFETPVILELPYTPAEGEDLNNIVIYYLDADGNLQNIGGVYDEATGTVRCQLTHFSFYLISTFDKEFSDLKDTHWAYSDIKRLTANQIINGLPDGSFNPDGYVTRAEFAKMATLIMKYRLNEDYKLTFTDVAETDWFAPYVSMATENGLIKGYPGNKFMPYNNITRQEMAVIVVRALGNKAKLASFSDMFFLDRDKIAEYAKDSVAIIKASGLLDWIKGDSFNPTANTTRAEAAAILYRLLKLQLTVD